MPPFCYLKPFFLLSLIAIDVYVSEDAHQYFHSMAQMNHQPKKVMGKMNK